MKNYILICSVVLSSFAYAQPLSYEKYKSQVQNSDPSWKSVETSVEAANLLKSEADAITGLQLVSQFGYLDDRRPTVNPGFQGSRTQNTGFLFGIKQQSLTGIQWELSQNFSHTKIYDAATTAIPVPDYYDAYPRLDLTIPLWRNFAGSETSALVHQTEQLSVLRLKQSEISKIQKEIEIENAYDNVLALQQSVEIEKDSIARAEKILEWTKSRIQRNLTDASDIYQAQAAISARKVEMITIQKNLADAISKFNSMRGIQSSELSETLITREIEMPRLKLSKAEPKLRKDLQLKKLQTNSDLSAATVNNEKHKPQLDLSVSALTQGRDTTFNASQSNTYTDHKDYMMVALNLTVPLNQAKESDYRRGYTLLQQSQSKSLESQQNDDKLTWDSTVETARQLSEQVQIVRELELLQKNKANAEREKFNRGRSTTFQVLSYEQDYFSTRSQRINLELQTRQFISQLNLFE